MLQEEDGREGYCQYRILVTFAQIVSGSDDTQTLQREGKYLMVMLVNLTWGKVPSLPNSSDHLN